MRRLLAGVAAAVILAGSSNAASGFSLFGSDKPDKPAQSDGAKAAAAADSADKAKPQLDAKTLEANLTSELAKAKAMRQQGDFGGAAHALAQLMLVAPDDARVIGEYGKVMVNQGRSDDAIAFLKHGLDLTPNDWTLYSAIGMAYDQKDDFANAKLAYDRALLLAPGEPAVLNNYAMSRMLAGDLAGAQKYMAQAMAHAGAGANPKLAENAALIARLSGQKTAAATAAEHPSVAATVQPAPAAAVKTQSVAAAQPPQTAPAAAAKTAPSAIEKTVVAKAVKAASAPMPPAQPQSAIAAPVPAAVKTAAAKSAPQKPVPQKPVVEKAAPEALAKAPPRPIIAAPVKEMMAKAEPPKAAKGATAKAAKPSLLPEAVSVADLSAPVMVKRKSGMVMMQRVPMDPEAGPVEAPAPEKAEPPGEIAKAVPVKAEAVKTRIADAKKDASPAAKAPPPQLRTAAD